MKIKKLEEFTQINEAAGWEVGSIALVKNENIGQHTYRGYEYYTPQFLTDAPLNTVFYMKITRSGRKWINGTVYAANCVNNVIRDFRVQKTSLLKPEEDWNIFLKDRVVDISSSDNRQLYNDEYHLTEKMNVMNMNGESTRANKTTYQIKSFNFELTKKLKETVVVLTTSGKADSAVCVPLSDLKEGRILNDHNVEIAKYLQRKLDLEIDYSGGAFSIQTYSISATLYKFKIERYDHFLISRLFYADAQKLLKDLKELKIKFFDVETLTLIRDRKLQLSLNDLLALMNNNGIEMSIEGIKHDIRGAVAGQKFDV